MNYILKQIRYIIEAPIVLLAMIFFYILGEKNASNFGSFLARMIGKRHYSHGLAYDNLSNAMPNLSEEKKQKILDDMWDNLGRIIGEYPHLAAQNPHSLMKKYIIDSQETIRNIEFLKNLPKKGGIIFSGHFGNWEVGPKFFMEKGFDVSAVYRPLNNIYVEKLTAKIRGAKLIAKSSKGSREIIEAIKNGKYIIIMADQKVSEGESVLFFHDEAITTTSLARIALKYGVPLIPARCIRINREFKFELSVEKPLQFQRSSDINSDLIDLTRLVNLKLEEWVKQYPAQWFWVHNRWKK
ncbi:MAG TPA: lysophospholipid acyltransferase family protein [Rickettsiales bacterium]|nr:lysophospholipid acyltransferase family protein [Rickettsiales bacterium]